MERNETDILKALERIEEQLQTIVNGDEAIEVPEHLVTDSGNSYAYRYGYSKGSARTAMHDVDYIRELLAAS